SRRRSPRAGSRSRRSRWARGRPRSPRSPATGSRRSFAARASPPRTRSVSCARAYGAASPPSGAAQGSAPGTSRAPPPSRPRARLVPVLAPRATEVVARSESEDGTTKLLVRGRGGDAVEAVAMPLAKRTSGCVSSQVGCAAGCAFCASGLQGLSRSLEPYEIVEQVLHLEDVARERGARLSNLVFMGMGEPMHAYDSVVAAIRLLTDPR